MRRFLPRATSFKSSSSVRLENILLALATTSRQELIATCTDNLWDVIDTSTSLDSCPSFMQPCWSRHSFGAESLVVFQADIGDAIFCMDVLRFGPACPNPQRSPGLPRSAQRP